LRPEPRQTQPAETQPAEAQPAEAQPAETAGHPAEAATGGRRARAGSARLAPQALADARGEALEGLDWLGREPESRASILYRALRLLARFVLFGLFRFRIRTSGTEHLPRGGYLLVAAAHRGWVDPFVVLHAMPASPRAWFLGSAPSTFTSRTREWLIRRVGGLLPVWRGGVGIEQHVRAARAVVANGGVFVQMPEGTINGPAGRIGTFRNGWALIALRTRAPIVPFAMAGTEDLYLGKRMASRVLPPTSIEDLLGVPAPVASPAQGSKQELELARRLTDALAARIGPVVEELQPWTLDPPGHPRRLRRWLTWLLLHPGGINRER
jgi:1-acyl-sn-glycerol-3-phosphate acyltransferase